MFSICKPFNHPKYINSIRVLNTIPSNYMIKKGEDLMDSKLPTYREIKNLPKHGQRGYIFTLADYSKMLTLVLGSSEQMSIPAIEKIIPRESIRNLIAWNRKYNDLYKDQPLKNVTGSDQEDAMVVTVKQYKWQIS